LNFRRRVLSKNGMTKKRIVTQTSGPRRYAISDLTNQRSLFWKKARGGVREKSINLGSNEADPLRPTVKFPGKRDGICIAGGALTWRPKKKGRTGKRLREGGGEPFFARLRKVNE